MSTVLIPCPNCGEYVGVAIQPSKIQRWKHWIEVSFDTQCAAHVCTEEKNAEQQ